MYSPGITCLSYCICKIQSHLTERSIPSDAETSAIIHGGETNYVMATVTLFVTIFNLFTSLLHLIGFMGGEN